MNFLDSLLNNIDEAVIITDATGKILFFNEPALIQSHSAEISGPLREGEYLTNIAGPRRSKIVQGIINELNLRKRTERSFTEYTDKEGNTVYIDLNYIPILNDTKELTHIYIFGRDITAQKVFEKKLKTQTANIHNLIETANAVIIGVDMLGYITDWNEHCAVITGYTKQEAYTSKLNELLQIQVALNNNAITSEVIVTAKSGKKIVLLLSTVPRVTGTNEIIGFILVGQDITELTGYRKDLEMKVEERKLQVQEALKKESEAISLKRRFVSIASHELRTPLSTIQITSNFIKLQKNKIDPTELTQRLETIDRQILHMTGLLDDLLLFSTTEAGQSVLSSTPVNVLSLFTQVVEEVSHKTRHSHRVITDFFTLPEIFNTDDRLLRSITINLLTNAIKYSPGQPSVELIVRILSGNLIITVRDLGIGIHESEIDKIFEPFVRGGAVGSIPGMGLGLSIVRNSVELLKGTIRVTSRPGKETSVIVTIPELINTA